MFYIPIHDILISVTMEHHEYLKEGKMYCKEQRSCVHS